jgi:ADP-heptose:LPS heptosyltransferase
MRPHVLVARQDSAGDVLLAGPAVRAVATGAARVTVLCGPRGRAAAELLPGVDAVLCRHAPWIDAEPAPVTRPSMEAFVDELAGLGVDQAVVLTSFHQSPLPLALLLRMAGVATIAATSTDYPGSLLDVRHRVDDDRHEVERALSLVATLGYRLPAGDDGRLAVRRGPAGRGEPDSPGHPLGVPRTPPDSPGHPLGVPRTPPAGPSPYVVVHPGASAPARAPSPGWAAALVEALAAAGRRVVVTGGPGERALTARVAGRTGTDLGGRVDLAGLAEVLAGADVVVVGNTGPAHLAAAVGTPVVSLFAPVVPAARWRPWAVPHVLLGDQQAPCAGSRARACPVAGHPCLDGIPLEDVVAAVDELAPMNKGVPA